MKKLERVLIVDDDKITNTLNSMVIKKSNMVNHIDIALNGKEAIDYLITQKANNLDVPELILLDINMPVMNGWEFLNEYKKIYEGESESIIVMMLTSSMNKTDLEESKKYGVLFGFEKKPLTLDRFMSILDRSFN